MSYLTARTTTDASEDQSTVLGHIALDPDEHAGLVRTLTSSGLLQPAALATAVEDRATVVMRDALRDIGHRRAAVAEYLDDLAIRETERAATTGRKRTKVIPVNKEDSPLLSLGLVMSYAMAYDDGRLEDAYEFVPDWCHITTGNLSGDEPPARFLFSSYIWSHTWNLAASKEAKEAKPQRRVHPWWARRSQVRRRSAALPGRESAHRRHRPWRGRSRPGRGPRPTRRAAG